MATEKRLIDANELLENRDIHIVIGAGDNICIDIADIAKAPTVDAVPVVRCKDCKRWHAWPRSVQGTCPCSEHVTLANHFYSYGERKDNETI